MLHLIGGLDRQRVQPVVVLYEHKSIIPELERGGTPVHVVAKRRLPKQHSLQKSAGYTQARKIEGVASFGWVLRTLATFVLETLPSAFRVASVLRRERPDVVHVCNGFRGNMDAIVASRLVGVPCIVHAKGFDKFTFVERAAAPGVAAAVSMTQAIEDHCRAGGLRPPEYHVMYDGLDLANFTPRWGREEVRAELGVRPDVPLIGVIGHIQEWKGQRVLLEAMPRVLEAHPTAVAVVVGGVHRAGADYAKGLHEFVESHNLADHVVFTGERSDIPDLMSAMDIVTHTSVRPEPFGRVIIEAMSTARPVLATRAGGVPEFVHDGIDGLLVEPGAVEELAEALCSVLGDPALYAKLSAGARENAERFSVERHVAEMVALYESVARDALLSSSRT